MSQIEYPSISLNLGCGEQGIEWLNTNSPARLNFGLDHRKLISRHTNYLIAEAYNLSIPSYSVDHIFADYYFNPIGNEAISDFTNNPNIFLGDKYPSQLKEWYVNDMCGDNDLATHKLLQVRDILRSITLREVVRVLAPKGFITLIDHPHVSSWIEEQLKDNKLLVVKVACLTHEDFNRSESLCKLSNQGAIARKLVIIKTID